MRKLDGMNASGDFDTPTAIIVYVMIIGGFVVIFVAPIFALICAFVFLQIWQAKKNLTALAGRLGFNLMPNTSAPLTWRSCKRIINVLANQREQTGIFGQVRGRSVMFVKYMESIGNRYDNKWSEIAVSARADSFAFTLRPDNVAWKLIESLGHHEIKVGDKEFDRRWRVKSKQPETLKAILLPELRHQIDQVGGIQGEFIFMANRIRYREPGDFDNAKRVTRYESMLGLMCDLADAIEIAGERYSSPASNSP